MLAERPESTALPGERARGYSSDCRRALGREPRSGSRAELLLSFESPFPRPSRRALRRRWSHG